MSCSNTQLVQIEKPVYGGAFLARVEGKAVFVPLTLPGEEARVRMVEEKRGYALAEAEEIVDGVARRASRPAAAHFGACGGCHYQHADYDTQLGFKKAILRETLERGGVRALPEIEVLRGRALELSQPHSACIRCAREIRAIADAVRTPWFPISECPIAAPLLLKAASALAAMLRESVLTLRPTEMSLFCNGDESALLASIFIAIAGKVSYRGCRARIQRSEFRSCRAWNL